MNSFTLPLHLLSLAYVIWTAFHADRLGLLWMEGKKEKLDGAVIRTYHRHMWVGLCFMLLTGFLNFYPMREYLLARPQFYIKMSFVLVLIINGFAIGHLQKKAITHSFKELSTRERMPLFLSAGASTVGWAGAIIMAFFLLP